jgi:hypothetical protein
MTTFIDGPACGQRLMLRRAPYFLRVVELNGKWDALDQLADEPEPNEKLYAYEMVGMPSFAFVDFGGKQKHLSGCYVFAQYKLVPPQPDDIDMRLTDRWRVWARAHAPAFCTEPKP